MAGQKINDHGSWIGKGSSASVFPQGVKTKQVNSEEGAGAAMDYPDTDAHIKSDQAKGIAKAKGHPMKPGFRY